jgi:hypothetical protein
MIDLGEKESLPLPERDEKHPEQVKSEQAEHETTATAAAAFALKQEREQTEEVVKKEANTSSPYSQEEPKDEALQQTLRASLKVTTKSDLEQADLEQAIVLSLSPQKGAKVKEEAAMGGKNIEPLGERDANKPSIKGKEEVKAEVEEDYGAWSVSRLKRLLEDGGENLNGITEKEELVSRAKKRQKTGREMRLRCVSSAGTKTITLSGRGGVIDLHQLKIHLNKFSGVKVSQGLKISFGFPAKTLTYSFPFWVEEAGNGTAGRNKSHNDRTLLSVLGIADGEVLHLSLKDMNRPTGATQPNDPSAVVVIGSSSEESDEDCACVRVVSPHSMPAGNAIGASASSNDAPAFIARSSFEGNLKGYVFGTGEQGRGYYLSGTLVWDIEGKNEYEAALAAYNTALEVNPTDNKNAVSLALAASNAARLVQRARGSTGEEMCYGYLTANIVGIQYYGGVVNQGESIDLLRDTRNLYDKNAIRVDSVLSKQKIGFLKRDIAKALAPLMVKDENNKGIRFKGTSSESSKGRYSITCEIAIYGPVERYQQTFQHLRRLGFYLITPDHPGLRSLQASVASSRILPQSFLTGGGPSTSRSPHRSVVSSRTVVKTAEEMENDLDKLFDELDKSKSSQGVEKLTDAELSCVRSPLLKHQKEAVAWMLHREANGEKNSKNGLPKFFKKRLETKRTKDGNVTRQVYYHSITKSSQEDIPQNVLGGILADDMGLGKTLNVLSVIAISQVKAHSNTPTLVICPLSVMQNWESQADDHMHPGTMSTLTYHGSNKSLYLDDLSPYDLVITTYGTLAAEWWPEDHSKMSQKDLVRMNKRKAMGKTLFDISWRRLVLDEAHMIRNRSTKAFKACSDLEADHRWCLTGTPYMNQAEDIQSLFQFLDASPLKNFGIWNRTIGRPLKSGNSLALSKLRLLLNTICLRRTKALLKDRLPPRTVEQVQLQLDGKEKEAYDLLFRTSQHAFRALRLHGVDEVMKNYSNILELLLRLRQACCSEQMLPRERLANARRVLEEFNKLDLKNITLEQVHNLLAKIRGEFQGNGSNSQTTTTAADGDTPGGENDNEVMECAVCFECPTSEELRILRRCSHCFCHKCLDKITGMSASGSGHSNCPLCR